MLARRHASLTAQAASSMLLRRVLARVKGIHASTKRMKAGLQGSQHRQAKPYLCMQTMHLGKFHKLIK